MSQNIMLEVLGMLGRDFPKIRACAYNQDGHKGTAYTFSGACGLQAFSISETPKPVIYFFHMGRALREGLFGEQQTNCLVCADENATALTVADMLGELVVED